MSSTTNHALADRELVAAAQGGDTLALHALVVEVRKVAYRYSRSRLATYAGGLEVAEDVTQEICLAVVDVLPRYQDNGAPFVALVFAIASNKVADAQRRYARSPLHLVDELPEQVETALDPEQQVLARSDVDAALELLERLPARTALVIRLRAEGRSADEVGELVGMSANAVRVTQHRGLTKLRQLVAASVDHSERFADRRVAA